MTDAIDRAERRLVGVPRYEPRVSGQPGPVGIAPDTLAKNEAPHGPAESVLSAARSALVRAHRYPSDTALHAAIARSVGVDQQRVVVTNGADELAYMVGTVLIEPGDIAVLADPGFAVHEIVSRLNGARVRAIPLRQGEHDLAAMARAAESAAVVWLPNPHNPTGRPVLPQRLLSFLAAVPSTCVVVLDEAYVSFMDDDLRPDVNALLDDHPTLLVARSLSKDNALAGLRIGYGIGHPRLISLLRAARPPFSVNAAAIAAGVAALGEERHRDRMVAAVRAERRRFESFLQDAGVPFWPSQANFVMMDVREWPQIGDELARAGVAARDGSDFGHPGWLRITIGSPAQMSAAREAMRRAMF